MQDAGTWDQEERKARGKAQSQSCCCSDLGQRRGQRQNFQKTFSLFSSSEPSSALSLFLYIFSGCYWCSLLPFVLTEETPKGYFVKISQATPSAQDRFSFVPKMTIVNLCSSDTGHVTSKTTVGRCPETPNNMWSEETHQVHF